jgi:hypothetical protein
MGAADGGSRGGGSIRQAFALSWIFGKNQNWIKEGNILNINNKNCLKNLFFYPEYSGWSVQTVLISSYVCTEMFWLPPLEKNHGGAHA